MAIKSNKKNHIVKDLFTKKYKQKVVKPKKGKGSFKRIKKTNIKFKIISKFNYLISTLKLITILSSSDLFSETL